MQLSRCQVASLLAQLQVTNQKAKVNNATKVIEVATKENKKLQLNKH